MTGQEYSQCCHELDAVVVFLPSVPAQPVRFTPRSTVMKLDGDWYDSAPSDGASLREPPETLVWLTNDVTLTEKRKHSWEGNADPACSNNSKWRCYFVWQTLRRW